MSFPPRVTTKVCSYYLANNCTNPNCKFLHPPHINPTQTNNLPTPPTSSPRNTCRFYPNCTNVKCPFYHPTAPPPTAPSLNAARVCSFYQKGNCTNLNCRFEHSGPVEGKKEGEWTDHRLLRER